MAMYCNEENLNTNHNPELYTIHNPAVNMGPMPSFEAQEEVFFITKWIDSAFLLRPDYGPLKILHVSIL